MFCGVCPPVAKACQATLTLGNSNATNVPAGQTWVFPLAAQIVVTPNVVIKIAAPFFPGVVPVGETITRELTISIEFYLAGPVALIVRFPSPPPLGSFHWDAQDYIIHPDGAPISVPIEFTPRRQGPVTETLTLVSNAQGSPHHVPLVGRGVL